MASELTVKESTLVAMVAARAPKGHQLLAGKDDDDGGPRLTLTLVREEDEAWSQTSFYSYVVLMRPDEGLEELAGAIAAPLLEALKEPE